MPAQHWTAQSRCNFCTFNTHSCSVTQAGIKEVFLLWSSQADRLALCLRCVTSWQVCPLQSFMFVARLPRSVASAGAQRANGSIGVLPCLRRPASRLRSVQVQLSRRAQPDAGQWHQPLVRHKGSTQRHSRHILTRALDEDATDRQRSVGGSGSEAVARSGAGSTSSRLGELVNSPFDADIFSVALPALASIMLDAIMLLVDTGATVPTHTAADQWLHTAVPSGLPTAPSAPCSLS